MENKDSKLEQGTSPHHEQRTKQAERYKKSLEKKVDKEWFELWGDVRHPKGRKVILCQRTETGLNRQYVGRENEKKDFVKKLMKEGLIQKQS